MFNLTIVDHVRLSFGHVVQNYTVHTRAADRLSAAATYSRIALLSLMGVAVALSIAVLLGAGRPAHIALVAVCATAFAGFAVMTSLGIEERLLGHRTRANRLWLLCEGYRSLLAEIHDGLLDRDRVMARRDALIQQFHDIHAEGSPAHDATATAAAPSRPAGRALTEDQIDQFLPPSLRRGAGAEASAPASH